jgi:glycosyltransferase involved in cell wall biosynthesis
MKVLFATYPMAFCPPGGGEIQLLAYEKCLSKKGIQVELFNQWKPQINDCDIVHFFSCVGGSIHFCNFIKKQNIPLIISASLWISEETKHLYPFEEIKGQLMLADKIIANSDLECEALSSIFNLPREKFITILNGVNPIYYEKVESNLFRSTFKIYEKFVLNVGNIEPRKNQLRLILALKENKNLKLVLIGHIRDRDYFNKCIEVGGGQVIYIGNLPNDSELLRSAYVASELFCLPSTLETPGLAALEAFVLDVPIVITSEGSTKEYFHDDVEYIDPYDVESMSFTISRVLNNEKKISKSKFNYDWMNVTSPLSNLYLSLIKNEL